MENKSAWIDVYEKQEELIKIVNGNSGSESEYPFEEGFIRGIIYNYDKNMLIALKGDETNKTNLIINFVTGSYYAFSRKSTSFFRDSVVKLFDRKFTKYNSEDKPSKEELVHILNFFELPLKMTENQISFKYKKSIVIVSDEYDKFKPYIKIGSSGITAAKYEIPSKSITFDSLSSFLNNPYLFDNQTVLISESSDMLKSFLKNVSFRENS